MIQTHRIPWVTRRRGMFDDSIDLAAPYKAIDVRIDTETGRVLLDNSLGDEVGLKVVVNDHCVRRGRVGVEADGFARELRRLKLRGLAAMVVRGVRIEVTGAIATVAVLFAVPDRDTGKQIELQLGQQMGRLPEGEAETADWLHSRLVEMFVHEADEGLRYADGGFVRHPHPEPPSSELADVIMEQARAEGRRLADRRLEAILEARDGGE